MNKVEEQLKKEPSVYICPSCGFAVMFFDVMTDLRCRDCTMRVSFTHAPYLVKIDKETDTKLIELGVTKATKISKKKMAIQDRRYKEKLADIMNELKEVVKALKRAGKE